MRTSLRLLLCVVALVSLLGTGYAWIVASPNGASPDDDYHQTSIWCPQPIEDHCPVMETDEPDNPLVEVPETVDASSIRYAYHVDTSAAALDGMDDGILSATTRVDTGNYPGYYYRFMHLFVEDDVDRAILVMRWVNFGMAVVLYGGAFLLLTTPGRRLFAYTLLATSIPITIYFITSLNPSSWAFTGITSLWIGLHGFFTSASWRRVGLGTIGFVGAVLAAGARTDAAMYCAVVALAMTLFHLRRALEKKILVILPALVAMVGVFSFFATSMASNITSSPSVGDIDGVPRNPFHIFLSNLHHLPDVLINFWNGDLGWFDVPTPTIVGILALLITLVVVGVSTVRSRCDWHKVASLVILGGAVYGLPVMMLQMQLMYLSELGVQVRYIAPLMIVFFGMLMAGSPITDPPRLPWPVLLACCAGFAVAHSVVLHTLIRRYVTGMDVTGFNLDIAAEWWRAGGPSAMGTWVIGSASAALLLAVFFFWQVRPVTPSGTQPV